MSSLVKRSQESDQATLILHDVFPRLTYNQNYMGSLYTYITVIGCWFENGQPHVQNCHHVPQRLFSLASYVDVHYFSLILW